MHFSILRHIFLLMYLCKVRCVLSFFLNIYTFLVVFLQACASLLLHMNHTNLCVQFYTLNETRSGNVRTHHIDTIENIRTNGRDKIIANAPILIHKSIEKEAIKHLTLHLPRAQRNYFHQVFGVASFKLLHTFVFFSLSTVVFYAFSYSGKNALYKSNI